MFGNKQKPLQVQLPATLRRMTPVPTNSVPPSAHLGLKVSLGVLSCALLVLGFMVYRYEGRVSELEVTSPVAAADELSRVVNAVGSVYILPEGEVPTLAAIGDLSSLEGQPFFRNAQEGDEVLIYMNAKKAIIWRPSLKKIVEVGPLSIKGEDVQ